jgi:hypothetical protein
MPSPRTSSASARASAPSPRRQRLAQHNTAPSTSSVRRHEPSHCRSEGGALERQHLRSKRATFADGSILSMNLTRQTACTAPSSTALQASTLWPARREVGLGILLEVQGAAALPYVEYLAPYPPRSVAGAPEGGKPLCAARAARPAARCHPRCGPYAAPLQGPAMQQQRVSVHPCALDLHSMPHRWRVHRGPAHEDKAPLIRVLG